MAGPDAGPLLLTYGRRDAKLKRRLRRFFLVVVLLVSGVLGWREYGDRIQRVGGRMAADSRLRVAYRKCVDYSQAPSIVFDESSQVGPVLKHAPPAVDRWYVRANTRGSTVPPRGPDWPRDFFWSEPDRLVRAMEMEDGDAGGPRRVRCASGFRQWGLNGPPWPYDSPNLAPFIFLHGRKAHGKPSRLIVVKFDLTKFVLNDPSLFSVEVFRSPQLLLGCSSCPEQHFPLGFQCPPEDKLRLYFGQPDPVDESRFLIRYGAGARSGVIVGQLHPDDTVTLTAQEDPRSANGA